MAEATAVSGRPGAGGNVRSQAQEHPPVRVLRLAHVGPAESLLRHGDDRFIFRPVIEPVVRPVFRESAA